MKLGPKEIALGVALAVTPAAVGCDALIRQECERTAEDMREFMYLAMSITDINGEDVQHIPDKAADMARKQCLENNGLEEK